MATEKIKIKLQGHEKFPIREGWINKALMILPDEPDAFSRKDAPDLFGIGSNMVKSLRYWMRVFGLTNIQGTELSDTGKKIAKYDPYLENPFSLWIMHSYIAKNVSDATTWFMYFNRCDGIDLEKSEIERVLLREVTKYASGIPFSEKSLYSDVDVLLNMYSNSREKSDPEDKTTSPFSQLSLVKKLEGKYVKSHPNKGMFSDSVVLYELSLMGIEENGISIEKVINGECGLAKIYNLTSIMSNEYLDRLETKGYIRINRTAGLDMIYPLVELNSQEVIEDFYKNI